MGGITRFTAGSRRMIRITLFAASGHREVHDFEDDEVITFGRSPSSKIVLNANYVSRHHGEICRENGTWYVKDKVSKMGMTVIRGANREQIQDQETAQARELHGGETIQVLNVLMRVELDAAPQPEKMVLEPGAVAPAAVTQMSDLKTLQSAIRREGDKLALLFDLAKDLNLIDDLDGVLERIAQTVFESFPSASHYAVCVLDEQLGEYIPRIGMLRDGKRLDVSEVTVSRSIISMVLSKQMAMLFQSPAEEVDRAMSIMINRISSSMAVPLRGSQGFIGVMQVDNRTTAAPFSKADLDLLLVLANSAAFALERAQLQANIQAMFDGFVDASVTAIEARDPTTSGHSRRVAQLTVALAEAANRVHAGPIAPFNFGEKQLKEITYAGMLHDFGKVAVPERVLVKAERLYPEILQRVQSRFRMVRLAQRNALMEQALSGGSQAPPGEEALRWIDAKSGQFDKHMAETLAFIEEVSKAGFLDDERATRLDEIAKLSYVDADGALRPYLEEDELISLSVRRGTLTKEERIDIEAHVTHTFNFLQQIPWSKDLRHVADIVHAHHEKLDGTGYPQGIDTLQIPVQAKMLSVCDIFDAVTAMDRPYRSAMTVEGGIRILRLEAKAGKIDKDFVDLFVDAGVWRLCQSIQRLEHPSTYQLTAV